MWLLSQHSPIHNTHREVEVWPERLPSPRPPGALYTVKREKAEKQRCLFVGGVGLLMLRGHRTLPSHLPPSPSASFTPWGLNRSCGMQSSEANEGNKRRKSREAPREGGEISYEDNQWYGDCVRWREHETWEVSTEGRKRQKDEERQLLFGCQL